MHLFKSTMIATTLLFGASTLASAAGMTPAEMADARAKVQTAVALAELARTTKDGEAMLVAARLIASSGKVAMAGETGTEPKMYDAAQMAADAKAMGTNTAGATGYWINTCDYSGYCAWAWID